MSNLKSVEDQLRYLYCESEQKSTRRAVTKIRALFNPVRHRILNALQEHGQMSVIQLQIFLRMEQAKVSQHLITLRQAKYVKAKRDGKNVYYSLNQDECRRIAAVVRKFNAL